MDPDNQTVEPQKPDLPHDATVVLAKNDQGDQSACIFIKETYSFTRQGSVARIEPEPLYNNLFDPEESKKLLPGCDFWPHKMATDVIIQGKAHALDHRGAQELMVSVYINDIARHVRVIGKRIVSYSGPGAAPKFIGPEAFESMDLCWENAYGGIDLRVPVGKVDSRGQVLRLVHDHPGLYPRNPFGKGYVVSSEKDGVNGIELPNLETVDDPITPERLIVQDPRNWHHQPLPACFDWLRGHMYPRCVFFSGAEAWFPGPDDSIAEVRMGYLPKHYRTEFEEREPADIVDLRFCNEAPVGMIFPYLNGDEQIRLAGMHPQGEISFALPGHPPEVHLYIANEKFAPNPVLHTLLIKPEESCFSLLWRAAQPIPRPFIITGPGKESEVPIEFRIGQNNAQHIGEPPPYWAYAKHTGKTKIPEQMKPWYNIFDLPEE